MESNFIEDERTTIEVIAFVSNPGPVHVLGHFSCIGDPEKKPKNVDRSSIGRAGIGVGKVFVESVPYLWSIFV